MIEVVEILVDTTDMTMEETIIIAGAEVGVMIGDTMIEIEAEMGIEIGHIDTEIIGIGAENMKEGREAAGTMNGEKEAAETEIETMIETIDIPDMIEIEYRIYYLMG